VSAEETATRPWCRPSAPGPGLDLLGVRCHNCGWTTFPPTVDRCRECWSTRFETIQLPARGHLYSFTVVHRTFPGHQTPFAVGLVDLPHGGRIMARVLADELSTLTVGCPVIGVAVPDAPLESPARSLAFAPEAPAPEAPAPDEARGA
jgi:hypothetical protein